MGATVKSKQRDVRRDELRRYISEQGKVHYIFDTIGKLEDLTNPLEPVEVQRLGKAIDSRLKLLNKYLPDVKAVEVTGENGGPMTTVQMSAEDYKKAREQMLDEDDC